MSINSRLKTLLTEALSHVKDPANGLPDAVFQFALRIVPMINVDLLVRNAAGEHLLAWREDEYDAGWHVPGGIIRINERMSDRISIVAKTELRSDVVHSAFPIDIKEFFTDRGHFISLLFMCRLVKESDCLVSNSRCSGRPNHGALAWKKGVPRDIYKVHIVYSDWLLGRQPVSCSIS